MKKNEPDYFVEKRDDEQRESARAGLGMIGAAVAATGAIVTHELIGESPQTRHEIEQKAKQLDGGPITPLKREELSKLSENPKTTVEDIRSWVKRNEEANAVKARAEITGR